MTDVGRGGRADHTVMREVNRSLIIELLKGRSPMSRAAMAKETGLAKPTVSSIVESLIKDGLAREIGFGSTTVDGGRPPMLVEFNVRSQFVVGVHVGVRRTTVAVADAKGQEIARKQLATPRRPASDALAEISQFVRTVMQEAQAPLRRLAGVGVCVPGLVDVSNGVCMLAPNLGWRDVPVREVLEAALRAPIFVHNTAQACAVAESMARLEEDRREMVFLYVGSGIGAGVLSEGRLLHGPVGVAGEIGHCTMADATERCTCGKVGCLETVASVRAVAAAAAHAIAGGAWSELRVSEDGDIDVEELVRAAAREDPVAIEVLADAGRRLGRASAWLINMFSPRLLVIGGGLSDAGEALVGPLREVAREEALPQVAAAVEIERSRLGQEAKIRGAVLLASQASESYYKVVFQG